jgi:hypothetical protein
MVANKPHNSQLSFLQVLHQIRRLLNFVINDTYPDALYIVLDNFYDLHNKYFNVTNHDKDYVNAFITISVPNFLSDPRMIRYPIRIRSEIFKNFG